MAVEGSYGYNYIENMQMEREIKAKAAKEGGSWLMALASILAEIADGMMEKTFALAKDLDNVQDSKASIIRGGGTPGSMSENELTAKLQAQTQIMSMFMQAMNTIIKTVGEANKDVARKQ